MKTIKECLEELPEPYKTQAINNTNNITLKSIKGSLKNALYSCFRWKETNEGWEYWEKVANGQVYVPPPKKTNKELAEIIFLNTCQITGDYSENIETILNEHR